MRSQLMLDTPSVPYMYILQCADGSLYVGSTRDLEARVCAHQSGRGAAYTKSRRPVELRYAEEFDNVGDAFAREKQAQNWSRAKRLALIASDWDRLKSNMSSYPPLT